MRIGMVIYGSLDTVTGGYLYDSRLADHLRAHGDDVEVISLAWRNYARHLADNLSPDLARRLARGRYDLLLQDELNHPSLLRANRRLRAGGGCPIVAIVHLLRSSEHADARLRSLYAAAERRYLRGIDGAVFCSEATRAAADQLAGPGLAGVVAHPAADHLGPCAAESEVVRRARRGGPLRVVSVANVVRGKRLHVLVEALARLPLDGWRLTAVGSLTTDPAYVRRVRRLIARAGVAGNVRLAGEAPNADVAGFLAQSHVLAVPSSYEALGIAYLEAMRMGVPVIATAAGGAREVVEDGREGLLVEPGDAAGLARRIELLMRDRDRLLRMALAARDRAALHPSWDRSLGDARAFLRSVVTEPRGAMQQAAA